MSSLDFFSYSNIVLIASFSLTIISFSNFVLLDKLQALLATTKFLKSFASSPLTILIK